MTLALALALQDFQLPINLIFSSVDILISLSDEAEIG